MSVARQTVMLLASVLALLAFCWQANACFVEHAGLIPCCEQGSNSSAADDASDGDCCHVVSTVAVGQAFSNTSLVFREVGYQLRTFGAPDGPVEEIDHPPQILS